MSALDGYELQGKCLKVEPIRDSEKFGRVKAPQKIVDYAVGPIKRQRRGELNTMRRATGAARACDEEDRVDRYRHERAQRRARLDRRKQRGRYRNQMRKNSRASRLLS